MITKIGDIINFKYDETLEDKTVIVSGPNMEIFIMESIGRAFPCLESPLKDLALRKSALSAASRQFCNSGYTIPETVLETADRFYKWLKK
jgi:hypothetical protein